MGRRTVGLALLALSLGGCAKKVEDLRDASLRRWAHELCETMSHPASDHAALQAKAKGMKVDHRGFCVGAVDRTLPTCGPPFLAKATSPQQFVACLGFEPRPEPAAPRTLVECGPPSLRLRFSITHAKAEPFAGSRPRVLGTRSLHVAPAPLLDERDLARARLVERGDEREIVVELTEAAAHRFALATAAVVGDWMVLAIGGEEKAALLESAIGSGQLTFTDEKLAPADVCAAR